MKNFHSSRQLSFAPPSLSLTEMLFSIVIMAILATIFLPLTGQAQEVAHPADSFRIDR